MADLPGAPSSTPPSNTVYNNPMANNFWGTVSGMSRPTYTQGDVNMYGSQAGYQPGSWAESADLAKTQRSAANIAANPYLQNLAGVNQLQQGALGSQNVYGTGWDRGQQTAYLLGQGALAGAQPGFTNVQNLLNQMQGLGVGGLGGMTQFMQGQSGLGGQLQGAGVGQLGLSNLAQLQALQQAQQTTGMLSPELQSLVEQQRLAAIQQAQNQAYSGLEGNLSRLQAQMEGRGLGASSVASRGQADLMTKAAEQAQQGFLAAQQQAAQNEMNLRQLGLGQAQLQGQIGAGLGGQGLGVLGAGTGLLGTYGSPAQLQSQLGILQGLAGAQQGFQQQQLQNQYQALQMALGGAQQPKPQEASALEKGIGYGLGGLGAVGSLITGIGAL